ncbi:hypothetical protein D6T69_04485 [Tenacibaculum singaporense]|uniref:Uncharacterized protein n=1 Tax=Tenacibaculum singaporense TaxID=2358479 RepID=A0A3Q8RMB5_9FLAO|nr:hypothetical protein [Tenacibaculum singaporense]AZJ34819.1 hypothetical protein D6T69_04485 [Tenacibaculum singaporense]
MKTLELNQMENLQGGEMSQACKRALTTMAVSFTIGLFTGGIGAAVGFGLASANMSMSCGRGDF